MRERKTKITVAGMGYVGLSLAVLLAQDQIVSIYEIDRLKAECLRNGQSPIRDKEIEDHLQTKDLSLQVYTDAQQAFDDAELVIIATPTNYDPETHYFDTSSVENVLEFVNQYAPDAVTIIKSTIPIGYTKTVQARFGGTILFSPEFLREGRALYDNLYPSRIIVGVAENTPKQQEAAAFFAGLLQKGALKENIPTLFVGSSEAEAIKLFSNTYLAMRVAYFNELDTYAKMSHLDAKQLIQGISLDPRIGNHYNNPSFGYGGYCLPKDTKQLRVNYGDIPQDLISAIIRSNRTRKEFIAADVAALKPGTVGVYRLVMKAGSDNFRESSILDVLSLLQQKGVTAVIYEPMLQQESYLGIPVIKELEEFKAKADVILCNRSDKALQDVKEKLYTRDIFHVE